MPKILQGSSSEVEYAAQALLRGNLVVIPTETVYGLAADAMNKSAVKRIYRVKGRPNNHPVIVHISDLDLLNFWASEIPKYARILATNFWPGPMTLILRSSINVGSWVTGNQSTVGIRIPRHIATVSLLEKFTQFGGKGLAAPSANKFGRVSPTLALDVFHDLGMDLSNKDLIIDGGPCEIGIESTIIDCTTEKPRILRPGAITLDHLNQLKINVETIQVSNKNKKSEIMTPGNLRSHYSPKAKIKIGDKAKMGEGFLALKKIRTPTGAIRLGSPINSIEFARSLYQTFRKADNLGIEVIHVVIPEDSIFSEALKDRIQKASTNNLYLKNPII